MGFKNVQFACFSNLASDEKCRQSKQCCCTRVLLLPEDDMDLVSMGVDLPLLALPPGVFRAKSKQNVSLFSVTSHVK